MLSPGQLHKSVPKDLATNVEWRIWINKRALANKRVRDQQVEICRNDLLYYINTYVWQFNPKKKGGSEVAPFLAWDFQEFALLSQNKKTPGILWCIENDKDLLVLKSREMGASWLFLIVQDWMCRSFRNQQSLTISRNEDAVDCSSPDSLFWKIRFMHRHLPDWLRGRIDSKELYFGYRDTDSTITGEASTGRAGVGGRASFMFIDEFSQIREDFEVYNRTSDTAGCRIFNGTHRGLDTCFFKLSENPSIKKLVMHWTQHPDKKIGMYRWNEETKRLQLWDKGYVFGEDYRFVTDGSPVGGEAPGIRSPWYDEQCSRKSNSWAVAMDLDIDPKGTVAAVFDRSMLNSLITYCREPFWEGDVTGFDPDTGTGGHLMRREGGNLKLWINLGPDGKPPPMSIVVGGDVSLGLGRTPTCFSFFDYVKGEKIGEYTDYHIAPDTMAVRAAAMCHMFPNESGSLPMLVWEAPGPGTTFGRKLITIYERFYRRYREDEVTKKKTEHFGWAPTLPNKRALIDNYHSALRQRLFLNRSKEALEECKEFKFNASGEPVHGREIDKDDPTGTRSNHGDHVIADALAWMLAMPYSGPKQKEQAAEIQFGTLAWRRRLHQAVPVEQDVWR